MNDRSQGPDARPAAKVALYDAVPNPAPTAVVIHCSDPSFQAAFNGFVEQELKLAPGDYVPLVFSGGAGVLSQPMSLPKEFKFVKERIEFLRRHFASIKRVILINHEDCEYYATLADRFQGLLGSRLSDHMRQDMKSIAGILLRALPVAHGLSIELYYARFADDAHTKIAFERIKV
jgi:hypothetical protein